MNKKGLFFLLLLASFVTVFVWKFHAGLWHALQHPGESLARLNDLIGFRAPTSYELLYGVSILIGSLLVEMLIMGWNESALRRFLLFKEKSARTDLIYWLLKLFRVYAIVTFFISFGMFYAISVFIHNYISFDLGEIIGNDAIFYVAMFIIMDLQFYVWHVAMHKVNSLWMAHRFHHSAESFNLITATRVHFISEGLLTVFTVFVLALLGTPPEVYPFLYWIKEFWALWLHSNIRVPLGWLGDYIIATPQWHKVHHSIAKEHHDTNFGFLFVVWDRIFGTYHAPVPVVKMGFEGNPYNKKGVIYDSVHVLKSFYLSLIR